MDVWMPASNGSRHKAPLSWLATGCLMCPLLELNDWQYVGQADGQLNLGKCGWRLAATHCPGHLNGRA